MYIYVSEMKQYRYQYSSPEPYLPNVCVTVVYASGCGVLFSKPVYICKQNYRAFFTLASPILKYMYTGNINSYNY